MVSCSANQGLRLRKIDHRQRLRRRRRQRQRSQIGNVNGNGDASTPRERAGSGAGGHARRVGQVAGRRRRRAASGRVRGRCSDRASAGRCTPSRRPQRARMNSSCFHWNRTRRKQERCRRLRVCSIDDSQPSRPELACTGQGENKCSIGDVRATHSDPAKIVVCIRRREAIRMWIAYAKL